MHTFGSSGPIRRTFTSLEISTRWRAPADPINPAPTTIMSYSLPIVMLYSSTYLDLFVTDSSTPNLSGHRGLLVVYVFVLHLLSNFPEWSPLLRTTGALAPSSSQDPVSLRSRSQNDSNTVSVLVFTYAFITSPLQVLYMRRSGNAYHWALQTSWLGLG